MNRFLYILLTLVFMLSGCSWFGSPFQSTTKILSSKVENPFFYLPPENLKDYEDRTWILLAESKNKNWFYDPYSIYEDEENIVSFDMFVTERGYQNQLHPFNATSIGPYRQKIDCFGNYQWSEIFYAEEMPKQETYKNPLKPDQEWGWIKIRPKTSMAYIKARICGRKFLDEKDINYFLYQQGKLPYVREAVKPPKTPLPKDSPELWVAQFRNQPSQSDFDVIEFPVEISSTTPIFYEVINNQFKVLDAKKDIRQLRLASYNMDKVFSKREDLTFLANCQSKTYSLSVSGRAVKIEALSDQKDSLANVAFNRACGDHGYYMKAFGK